MTSSPPSVRVLGAIADREGVDPTDLTEPLYGVVDPEALDGLFQGGTGHVTFEYGGYEVTVDSSGDVDVDDLG